MTLSDPLLKDLKGHIATLTTSAGQTSFTDDNETVLRMCLCLESIFVKGIVRHDGFAPWKTDAFQWFYQGIRRHHRSMPTAYKMAFDSALNDKRTRTNIGKCRLLIRTCLKKRCLHVPVQWSVDYRDFYDETLKVSYKHNTSVLGHEILSQIFLSLLLQLSTYEFSLDLTNGSFLDESWQLPVLVKEEIVPCERLGLTLGFPMGYAVIVKILEDSMAAELGGKIAVGDILDEVDGHFLRNYFGSRIENLFKKCRKAPFRVTFIKGRNPNNGQIFLPMIKLYRILALDPELYDRRILPTQNRELQSTNPDKEDSNEKDTQDKIHEEMLINYCDDDEAQETNRSEKLNSQCSGTSTGPIADLLNLDAKDEQCIDNDKSPFPVLPNMQFQEIIPDLLSSCEIGGDYN